MLCHKLSLAKETWASLCNKLSLPEILVLAYAIGPSDLIWIQTTPGVESYVANSTGGLERKTRSDPFEWAGIQLYFGAALLCCALAPLFRGWR